MSEVSKPCLPPISPSPRTRSGVQRPASAATGEFAARWMPERVRHDGKAAEHGFTFRRRSAEHGFTSLRRSAEHGFTFRRRSAENGFTFRRRSAENGFTFRRSSAEHGFTSLRRSAEHGFTLVELMVRSEEHTSELQSLMRISYAVLCLKKKTIYYQT